ncbi:MAG: methyltransferase domain-containing protein [Candidatus Eremiobacteraeota bacterium]|nr:methyltransferase domain-containing protein [Candidatus Eremiobacteraeota bacterium]
MNMQPNKILDEKLWEMHLTRQFNWTIHLRKMLYDKADMKNMGKILDVGCGIGLISKEIHELSKIEVHGIDINEKLIEKAKEKFPDGKFIVGKAEEMPYDDNTFDCTFCQFLLMWIKHPFQVLLEMKRVTKPGGKIICAAEPDYGGKIDYPDDYNAVPATIRAIMNEGADPFYGRKLKATFARVGMKFEIGVSAELWDDETMKREFEHVWEFAQASAKNDMMKSWAKAIEKRDREALEKGERITFLPLFWGIGNKEKETKNFASEEMGK